MCEERKLSCSVVSKKKSQPNAQTLDVLEREVELAVSSSDEIEEDPLVGGWEELLNGSIKEIEENLELFGHPLHRTTTGRPNKNVTVLRPFLIVRPSIVTAMKKFFVERMKLDDDLMNNLRPIFSPGTFYSPTDLRSCHSTVCADLELRDFARAYKDLVGSKERRWLSVTDKQIKATRKIEKIETHPDRFGVVEIVDLNFHIGPIIKLTEIQASENDRNTVFNG